MIMNKLINTAERVKLTIREEKRKRKTIFHKDIHLFYVSHPLHPFLPALYVFLSRHDDDMFRKKTISTDNKTTQQNYLFSCKIESNALKYGTIYIWFGMLCADVVGVNGQSLVMHILVH